MAFDKRETIEKMKMEIIMLERGGYHPSVREPRKEPRIFRDSVSCLNVGWEEKHEPCSNCFLIQYVPEEHRSEDNPCHYIPLNEAGETVASLNHDRERLKVALLGWLYSRVGELEAEAAREGKIAGRDRH